MINIVHAATHLDLNELIETMIGKASGKLRGRFDGRRSLGWWHRIGKSGSLNRENPQAAMGRTPDGLNGGRFQSAGFAEASQVLRDALQVPQRFAGQVVGQRVHPSC
jgi:hypothetical protein